MNDNGSDLVGDEDHTISDFNGANDRLDDAGAEVSHDVEAQVEKGQSLIDQAKEMARRDWDNQYEDTGSGSDVGFETSEMEPSDLEAEIGGAFDDAQGDVGSSFEGDQPNLGGALGDPSNDFGGQISNKQAGLGGAIGVPDNDLGGTFGDDQIHAGGDFDDARGGIGSSNPLSANEFDAGLVTNDLQGAVDMNPAGSETRLGSDFDNVETSLTGGFGDEQATSGSKFDSVRSEVERNFSDVSGTFDSSADNAAEDVSLKAGDLRFGDSGIADAASASADNLNAHADGLGERARGAGMDLKQRAAEAREQASHRLEDARRELSHTSERVQTDGKSMVEDVQEKAKGLFNKVKDVIDGNKKS